MGEGGKSTFPTQDRKRHSKGVHLRDSFLSLILFFSESPKEQVLENFQLSLIVAVSSSLPPANFKETNFFFKYIKILGFHSAHCHQRPPYLSFMLVYTGIASTSAKKTISLISQFLDLSQRLQLARL